MLDQKYYFVMNEKGQLLSLHADSYEDRLYYSLTPFSSERRNLFVITYDTWLQMIDHYEKVKENSNGYFEMLKVVSGQVINYFVSYGNETLPRLDLNEFHNYKLITIQTEMN